VTPSSFSIAGTSDPTTAAISGTPSVSGSLTITVTVTDSKGATVSKQFTVQITAGALTISATFQANPVSGAAFSGSATATGGTAPYTYSGSLPAGLTIDPASGAISGTTSVTGPQTLTVNVKDSTGATASQTYTVTFAAPPLPPLPTVTITGVDNTGPAQQPTPQLTLGAGYPISISCTATLSFQPANGSFNNPEVQFSGGGQTTDCGPIAAGTTTISLPSLQTGTVAGTITITATLTAGSQTTTETRQIVIPASPPSITVAVPASSVTANGFTVVVTGFSTTLDMTQATFTFNAGSGTNLQTTSLTVQLGTLFSTYYQNNPAATSGIGSQFVYTQPFTITGGGAITSVTVTLTNSNGTSQSATANI